jgi:hypothetical protein
VLHNGQLPSQANNLKILDQHFLKKIDQHFLKIRFNFLVKNSTNHFSIILRGLVVHQHTTPASRLTGVRGPLRPPASQLMRHRPRQRTATVVHKAAGLADCGEVAVESIVVVSQCLSIGQKRNISLHCRMASLCNFF